MNADQRGFKHRGLTEKIIGIFFDVYNELGHGVLESVYERSLEIALKADGLAVCRQIQIPVEFRGQSVGDFTADILVDHSVLLELKVVRSLDTSHEAQLLNYLRATSIEVGLLLNLARSLSSNAWFSIMHENRSAFICGFTNVTLNLGVKHVYTGHQCLPR